jgi:catechol 2,3-dioxygenase-like lactoylglutathione lyase family enzyme
MARDDPPGRRVRSQPRYDRAVPRLRGALPYRLVADVEETAAYYRDVLGFRDQDRFGALLMATRGGVTLMFREALHREMVQPARNLTGDALDVDAYIWVGDAEGLLRELRASGAAVLTEVVETEHLTREFEVEDLNGYVLCFAQDMSPAGPPGIGRVG